jgi:YVTN family beta-propeller protein
MSNLLTAAEAFAALQNGKTVLCRPAGDVLDFADLDQFPASVFGKPGFEFCIKIETIELAGITFTKPLTIDEYEEGQEVYVISTYSPTVYVLDFKTNALIDSINSGFVQRDAENAKLQLKALSKALGFEVNDDLSVIRLGEEPKKQRGKKSKAEKPSEVISAETQPTIVITEQTNVTTSEDLLIPETNEPKVDPEYQQTLDTLLQRVKESKTPAEVNAVYRYTRTWDDEQMKPILLATHKRLEELEKEQASTNEPPSLMVQIQNAPDLTTLDALEIDVAARDPQIQPKLMGYVRKRRYELENPAVSQPEAEPDYLLVDGF